MARRGDGIYQRGRTWWLDFVHEGKRRYVKLGKGITRTVAGEIAVVKRGKVLKGEAGIGEPTTTVKEYADRWIKAVAGGIAPKTLQGYQDMLDRYILPRFESMKLAALDRAAIKALLADKLAKGRTRQPAEGRPPAPAGLSKNTVRLIRATLSVMLADALDEGLIKSNPAQGLSRRGRKGPGTITHAERQKKIRPLTQEQLRAFLGAAQSRVSEWTLFLTLADTGMRPSESLALRWEDLDRSARTLWVERALSDGQEKATKTETMAGSRAVDLTPRLADALDRWQVELEKEALTAGRDPAPWIFPSATGGRPLDLEAVARRFRLLLSKAGVPRRGLYDLRHTYATHMLSMGAPITYVAAQLGHAKPTTTLAFYAHWLPTAERTWAERLERNRTGFPDAFHDTRPVPVGASPASALDSERKPG
jgi:integrase